MRFWPKFGGQPRPEPTPSREAPATEQGFVTRHSIKPKGEDKVSAEYPGISGKGVEKAMERSQELLDMLEKAPPGAVMFVGGASELVRTASTAEAYGDGLKDLVKERGDIEVITRGEIQEEGAPEGYSKAVQAIADRIAASPDKKFVVDLPLFLKGMTAAPFVEILRDEKGKVIGEGKLNEYFVKMGEKTKDEGGAKVPLTEYEQLSEWMRTGGQAPDGEPQGPDPAAVGKGIEDSLKRLREFGKRYIGDRPLIVGMVGHSFFVDAFLLQAALGKISEAGLHQMTGGRRMIKETEAAFLEFDPENEMLQVSYRGNRFRRSLEDLGS